MPRFYIYLILLAIKSSCWLLTNGNHFRGGSATWKTLSQNLSGIEVQFSFEYFWTQKYVQCNEEKISTKAVISGEKTNWTCSYGCVDEIATTESHCISYNNFEDIATTANVVNYFFSYQGVFNIGFASCCWASSNGTNESADWSMSVTVILGNRSDTNKPNNPPVTHSPNHIKLVAGVPDVISIDVSDEDGDKIVCRLGTNFGECGRACQLPEEFNLIEDSCHLQFKPNSNRSLHFPFAVVIEDYHLDNKTIKIGDNMFSSLSPLSKIPLQFLISVVMPYPGSCLSWKPSLDIEVDLSKKVKVSIGDRLMFQVIAVGCNQNDKMDVIVTKSLDGLEIFKDKVQDKKTFFNVTWLADQRYFGDNKVCFISTQENGNSSNEKCLEFIVHAGTRYCMSFSPSQFITFDGVRFSFIGNCRYQLATTQFNIKSNLTNFHHFNLTVNLRVDENGVPTLKGLELTMLQRFFVFGSNRQIWIDGKKRLMPIRLPGVTIDIFGKYVTLNSISGLILHFDGRSSFIIELPSDLDGLIDGLCGNMNQVSSDDLIKSKSHKDLSLIDKVKSYQISSSCKTKTLYDQGGCDLQKIAEACSIISKDDCFSTCQDTIDPMPFVQSCIDSICSGITSLIHIDTHIQAYADVCRIEGLRFCDWRQQFNAVMECPPHSHYNSCITENQKRCTLLEVEARIKSCVEGCECDEGYVLAGPDNCVLPKNCGDFINSSYRQPGFTYRTNNCENQCTCNGRNDTKCEPADPCNQEQRCLLDADGFHQCLERLPNSKVCRSIADSQIETFDGQLYSTETDCSLVLIKSRKNSVLPEFSVYISKENTKKVQNIFVQIANVSLSLEKNKTSKVNGKIFSPGSSFEHFRIRLIGSYLTVSFNFGLVIRWNGNGKFIISGWGPLQRQVEGLCGNFDGDPSNDLSPKNGGGLLTDLNTFVNSWILTEHKLHRLYFPVPIGENFTSICLTRVPLRLLLKCVEQLKRNASKTCQKQEIHLVKCDDIDEDKIKDYRNRCQPLRDENGPFSTCHKILDPENFFQKCVGNLCKNNGDAFTLDAIIKEYTQECFYISVSLVPQQDFFQGNCSVNSFLNECMSQCQPSCEDPDASVCLSELDLGINDCITGCQCIESFVLSDGQCVSKQECGCQYRNKYFLPGSFFRIKNCSEECTCLRANITSCLPTDPCKVNYKCVTSIEGIEECEGQLRKRATCKVTGGSHYVSFDQTHFDNLGTCAYIMVKNKENSTTEKFRIVAVSEKSKDQKANMFHIREVHLHFGENDETISLLQDKVVKFNNKQIFPGTKTEYFSLQASSASVVVETTFQIVLKWDGRGRLRITALGTLRNKVEGLCGTFDDNKQNDFLTSSGRLTDDVDELLKSWVAYGHGNDNCLQSKPPTILNLCKTEHANIKFSKKCSIFTDTDGPFGECHKHVPPISIYTSCLYDMCASNGSEQTLTTLIESYKTDCFEEVNNPSDWLNQLEMSDFPFLDEVCDENEYYTLKGPACIPTCADPEGTQCKINDNLDDSPIPGCVCNPGFLFSNTKCVPVDECGCDREGIYYPLGFELRDQNCSYICKCVENGEFSCENRSCSKLSKCSVDSDGYHRCLPRKRRRATCKAVTDPHYMTFDGTRFDYMGTCSYIMTRSKTNYTGIPFTVVAVNQEGNNTDTTVSHVHEVYINFNNSNTIQLKDFVKLNGISLNPGFNRSGIEVRKSGLFTLVDWTDIGLVIRWDGIDRLRITISDQLRYQVEGVCGNFNDDLDDDLMTPDGVVESNIDSFVDSWAIDGYGAKGCFKPSSGLDFGGFPGECDDLDILQKYQDACYVLIDPESPLKDCRKIVDPEVAFDACVYDQCAYNGDTQQMERVIASYVDDCLELDDESNDHSDDCKQFQDLNRIQPPNWRLQSNMTVPNCPVNSHYNSCMSQCQPSCDDVSARRCICNNKIIGSQCVEGCQADDGYFISGSSFVSLTDCGCSREGFYYLNDQVFMNENCSKKCRCLSGAITCRPNTCGVNFECRTDPHGVIMCLPIRTSSCEVWGNLQFRTFDGKVFEDRGACTYDLIRPITLETEKVQLTTIQNGTFTQIDSITIEMMKQNVLIHLTKNDVKDLISGNKSLSDYSSVNHSDISIRKQGKYIVVSDRKSHSIEFDGSHVIIKLPINHDHQIKGLCGNFNGDPGDDVIPFNGIKDSDSDKNFLKFIRSYQDEDCLKEDKFQFDVCDDKDKWISIEFCGLLLDIEGVFADCINAIEIDHLMSHFEHCLEDMCSSEGNQDVIESYAHYCLSNHVRICDWRIQLGFELNDVFDCPINSHYEGCASSCPEECGEIPYESCQLVENCVCDDGFILMNNSCVQIESCYCQLDNRNLVGYNSSYRNEDCSRLCYCYGLNRVICESTEGCSNHEECVQTSSGTYQCDSVKKDRATCKLINSRFYTTFDGYNFDLLSNCSYYLIKSNNSTVDMFEVIVENILQNESESKIKRIKIRYKNNELILRNKSDIRINNELVYPGTKRSDFLVSISGSYILIGLPIGISLKWDFNSRLRVDALEELQNQLNGLCGNFDGDDTNDIMLHDTVVTLSDYFSNNMVFDAQKSSCNWKANKIVSSDCDIKGAREFCSEFFFSDNNSNLTKCSQRIDPKPFYRNCITQWCSSIKAATKILSSYLEDCTHEGFTGLDYGLLDPCPINSRFSDCLSHCEPICLDEDQIVCKEATFNDQTCSPGCECEDGYIWNGSDCILSSNCGCVTEFGHYMKPSSESYLRSCSIFCVCEAGTANCFNFSCFANEVCIEKNGELGCEIKNECKYQNAGCSHYCHMNETTVLCSCPPHFILDTDNKTCIDFSSSANDVQLENCEENNEADYEAWKFVAHKEWNQKLQICLNEVSSSKEHLQADFASIKPSGSYQFYWTRFFDLDDPDGDGDYETLSEIRAEYANEVCEVPTTVEAYLLDGRDRSVSGNELILGPKIGLICLNKYQNPGNPCQDFKIRFLCFN